MPTDHLDRQLRVPASANAHGLGEAVASEETSETVRWIWTPLAEQPNEGPGPVPATPAGVQPRSAEARA